MILAMPSAETGGTKARHNNIGAIRLALALLVIFSHSY
jgi:hypothetical protein